MSANPILLLVGALGALIGALVLFGEETQASTDKQKELNNQLSINEILVDSSINKQIELQKLRGRLLENETKDEVEKLKIRKETDAEIAKLEEQAIKRRIKENNDLLDSIVETEDLSTIRENERYKESIQRSIQLKTQLEVFNKSKETNEAITNLNIERAEKEALSRRLKAQQDFNTDAERAAKKRADELIKLERELEDFLINRISKGLTDVDKSVENLITLSSKTGESFALVGDEFNKVIKNVEDLTDAERENAEIITVNNDDIIKGYEQRIVQLEFLKKRQIDDAKEIFDNDIKTFKETEKARKDSNGNRLISDAEINKSIEKQTELFEEEQLRRGEIFTIKIEAIEKERADKIREIDEILKKELAFGDNNLNDNRLRLLLEVIEAELLIQQRRIDLEKGANVELIKERQKLEAQRRKLVRDSLIETEKIERDFALKSLQGTEEQKAKAREEILKASNDRIARINEEFRSQEETATIESEREILNAQIQRFNQYSAALFSILNSVNSLNLQIQERNRVSLENQVRDVRDSFDARINESTIAYNKEIQLLNERFSAGRISQENYNEGIRELDSKLSGELETAEKERKAIDLQIKEKAFEEEKKLRIAQATISGFQGALQAFVGPFSNPFLVATGAAPVIGGILSALVATTTAFQIANIRNTKFDRGGADRVGRTPTIGGGAGSLTNIQTRGSEGGLTQFNENLVGTPSGRAADGEEFGTGSIAPGASGRVFVLESDITKAQRRVAVAESSATFG
jgi:hypothetical protein